VKTAGAPLPARTARRTLVDELQQHVRARERIIEKENGNLLFWGASRFLHFHHLVEGWAPRRRADVQGARPAWMQFDLPRPCRRDPGDGQFLRRICGLRLSREIASTKEDGHHGERRGPPADRRVALRTASTTTLKRQLEPLVPERVHQDRTTSVPHDGPVRPWAAPTAHLAASSANIYGGASTIRSARAVSSWCASSSRWNNPSGVPHEASRARPRP
jgi:hypothetical protein